MPMAHDIGRTGLFVQVIPYPISGWWPLAELGFTQEIEGDYRSGRSLVLRLPGQRALVLGRWSVPITDEDAALTIALQARGLTDEELLRTNEAPTDVLAAA